MQLVYPDYYWNFKCIAHRCRHNCCIGWEIDIDEDTYSYYNNFYGEFAERLKMGISQEPTPHFILDENDRCPFLKSNGLCDVVLNMGEDALCQICADHPRFKNFYSNRVEVGLGLCCEEAARIILSKTDKVILVESTDSADLLPEEIEFIALRQKIFDIVQNRNVEFKNRILQLLKSFGLDFLIKPPAVWAEFFEKLERLDDQWEQILSNIKTLDENDTSFDISFLECPFEQLAVYFVYRHLSGAIQDDKLVERIQTICLFLHMIRLAVFAEIKKSGKLKIEKFYDICRIFSAEIEYSDQNIDKILSIF